MSKKTSPISQKQVANYLQPRLRDSHKGRFGTVTVIGGASGMVGAALLAGRAALKLGAGCVHVALLADDAPVVDIVQPELMLHRAEDALRALPRLPPPPSGAHTSPDGTTSHSTRLPNDGSQVAGYPPAGEGANVKSTINSVLAVGCGMGTSIRARKLLHEIIGLGIPLVLDADALNLLARHADLQDDLRARHAPTVITPHPGEAARLLGIGAAQIQADRVRAARQLSEKLHCIVALKGADTVCVTRNGNVFVNKTGNPGMSAPGMGDVLTGMIAAFIAQGLDADQALLLAAHLHGSAGDALAKEGISVGMTASELTDWARWLLNRWTPNR
jgi:hydroxyethylthiazole kinase-like uncharacterized protein yjeF